MKESIKHFFPLILTVLCALSGISFLFHGFSNPSHGLFLDIGTAFSDITQKTSTTNIPEKLGTQEKEPFPTLVYVGNTLIVGNTNSLLDLFLLQTSTGNASALGTFPDTTLYLVDVKSEKGTSLLTTLSTSEIENLEEIPSNVIYDPIKKHIYFYQSGIYTLCIRLYYNHHPGVLFECQIPVEAR